MDEEWTTSSLNHSALMISSSGPRAATESARVEMWSAAYRGRNKVIGLIGAILNVLTLAAIIKHKDLTKFLRCALASLVSTDLGLLATIFVSSLLYLPPDGVTLCVVKLVYIFCDCTALTLLVIAVDRACALYLPVWYKSIGEHSAKITLVVVSPWPLAVCLSVASFKSDIRGLPRYPIILLKECGVLLQGVFLLTCGTGVLLAYVAIGLKLRLRARRFTVHPSFLNSSAMGHLTPSEYQRCRRLTIHTLFLAAWFCVIYISFSCYLLTVYVTQTDPMAEFNSTRNICFSSIIMINSIVNPFLFFWRLVDVASSIDYIRRLVHVGHQAPPQQIAGTQTRGLSVVVGQMEERERHLNISREACREVDVCRVCHSVSHRHTEIGGLEAISSTAL